MIGSAEHSYFTRPHAQPPVIDAIALSSCVAIHNPAMVA